MNQQYMNTVTITQPRSHLQKLLLEYLYGLNIAWSVNSKSFALDNQVSNERHNSWRAATSCFHRILEGV